MGIQPQHGSHALDDANAWLNSFGKPLERFQELRSWIIIQLCSTRPVVCGSCRLKKILAAVPAARVALLNKQIQTGVDPEVQYVSLTWRKVLQQHRRINKPCLLRIGRLRWKRAWRVGSIEGPQLGPGLPGASMLAYFISENNDVFVRTPRSTIASLHNLQLNSLEGGQHWLTRDHWLFRLAQNYGLTKDSPSVITGQVVEIQVK